MNEEITLPEFIQWLKSGGAVEIDKYENAKFSCVSLAKVVRNIRFSASRTILKEQEGAAYNDVYLDAVVEMVQEIDKEIADYEKAEGK